MELGKKTTKNTSLLFFSFFILLSFFSFSDNSAHAEYIEARYDSHLSEVKKEINKENKQRVVKVGWFVSPGVHRGDSINGYSGYDYDFLLALAQYANWKLEFVEGDWFQCYNQLAKGEIDVMGIVNKTPEREKVFDFSYTSSGIEYCNIYTTIDKNISYRDYKKFNGIRIGVEKFNIQEDILRKYAKENGFSYTQVNYSNTAEAAKYLDAGDIDAFICSNTDGIKGYSCIDQFNAMPFYYAVTKGNTTLLKELNEALHKIYSLNPDFTNDLYKKYFIKNTSLSIKFTNKEIEFIKKNPVIKVLYDSAWFPIEYYDEDTQQYKGIFPEIVRLIEKKSGLHIQPVGVKNSVEILKQLRKNGKNFITSISYDYQWAEENNTNITQPFGNCSIVKISNTPSDKQEKVALVELDYITENIKKIYPDIEPVYYQNIEQCLNAVLKGKADCTYINSYQAEYYIKMIDYRSLYFHAIDDFSQKLCFGISKNSSPELFSIISKTLKGIPQSQLQHVIYSNIIVPEDISLKIYIKNNPVQFLIIIFLLAFIAIFIAGYIIFQKLKNKRRLEIENDRYNQVIKMTGEQIFEYSYEKDILTIKNKSDDFYDGDEKIKNFSSLIKNKEEANHALQSLYDMIKQHEDTEKEIEISSGDQSTWYSFQSRIVKNEEKKPIYAVGKIQNIDEEVKKRELLIEDASMDGLTGLLNQKYFKLAIEKQGIIGTLFIVDIDDFKRINDTCGHSVGDEAIIAVSKILKQAARRSTDIIGRIGGDEFAIFLPEVKAPRVISQIASNANQKVRSIILQKADFYPTISIGIAIANGRLTYKELFKRADKALYNVKEKSKDNFEINETD